MDKLVSIVIPVYNAAEYLDLCLQSIIKQTYQCLEIIVVNDGSTDKSYKIIQKYQKKDSRIIVFDNENHGVSYSRNYGISYAHGEYLIFIDSDDYIDSRYIEKLVNAVEKNRVNLAICRYKTFSKGQKFDGGLKYGPNLVHSLNDDFYFLSTLGGLPYGPVGKIYKLDIIKNHNIKFREDISNGEDQIFNFSYFKKVNNYCLINEELYFYQIHNNSLSRNHSKKMLNDLYIARKYLVKFLQAEKIPYYKEILAAHCMTDLIDYISVDNDGYQEYKKRVKKVERYILEGTAQNSLKAKILCFLLKNSLYLPIFLFYKLKY